MVEGPKNSRKRSFERNSKKESTKLFKYLLKVRYDPSIGNFERDAEKNFLRICAVMSEPIKTNNVWSFFKRRRTRLVSKLFPRVLFHPCLYKKLAVIFLPEITLDDLFLIFAYLSC